MARKAKAVSGFFKEESKNSPEMMMREAYLQTSVELLDGMGIETWTVERLHGAVMMMEKFVEIRESNY